MSESERDTSQVKAQIEALRVQEEKLIQLKRQLLGLSISSADEAGDSDETASFLIVKHLERCFAIPVNYVDEVFDMVAVTALSEQRPGVVGLIDYHGKLIVLLDLGEIAGAGRSDVNPDNIIVLCTMHQWRFGLMVRDTSDVVTVDKRQIKAADELMSGVLKAIGVIHFEQVTATVIDLWSTLLSVQLDDAQRRELPPPDTTGTESDP